MTLNASNSNEGPRTTTFSVQTGQPSTTIVSYTGQPVPIDSNIPNTVTVFEDLSGIRENGKARCVHEWSFAQLQWMVGYKAARAGVEVVYIDPRYASRTCSRCLHIGVRQNQSNFYCRNCGYQINADLNGAKSIALRHDQEAMGRLFCEYLPKKVNRPEAVRSWRLSAGRRYETWNRKLHLQPKA